MNMHAHSPVDIPRQKDRLNNRCLLHAQGMILIDSKTIRRLYMVTIEVFNSGEVRRSVICLSVGARQRANRTTGGLNGRRSSRFKGLFTAHKEGQVIATSTHKEALRGHQVTVWWLCPEIVCVRDLGRIASSKATRVSPQGNITADAPAMFQIRTTSRRRSTATRQRRAREESNNSKKAQLYQSTTSFIYCAMLHPFPYYHNSVHAPHPSLPPLNLPNPTLPSPSPPPGPTSPPQPA